MPVKHYFLLLVKFSGFDNDVITAIDVEIWEIFLFPCFKISDVVSLFPWGSNRDLFRLVEFR